MTTSWLEPCPAGYVRLVLFEDVYYLDVRETEPFLADPRLVDEVVASARTLLHGSWSKAQREQLGMRAIEGGSS
jgi:hypothetical protein